MAGDVDYLLKLAVRDIAHYDRIYRKLIAAVPDLADVSSTLFDGTAEGDNSAAAALILPGTGRWQSAGLTEGALLSPKHSAGVEVGPLRPLRVHLRVPGRI